MTTAQKTRLAVKRDGWNNLELCQIKIRLVAYLNEV